jgi:hypothetical protein
MKRTMLIAGLAISAALLTGCAGNIRLLSEGKSYAGTYNTGTKAMNVDVEGIIYTGSYVLGQTFGISNSQAFATATGGHRPMFVNATGFSTTSTTSNQGRALLVGSNNKTIRCDIMVSRMSGQGLCQDSDGRVYDLIASGQ